MRSGSRRFDIGGQDALCRLEHDYKTPNKHRSDLIVQLKGMVTKLKATVAEDSIRLEVNPIDDVKQ